jgi:hypothetical protein
MRRLRGRKARRKKQFRFWSELSGIYKSMLAAISVACGYPLFASPAPCGDVVFRRLYFLYKPSGGTGCVFYCRFEPYG